MFKKLAFSAFLLAAVSGSLFAQQATSADVATQAGKKQSMMGQHPMADAPTRAKKMSDRITQSLSLDQATSQKVYDATLARDQKIDAIQASSDDNKAKDQALKANADDYKAKMKSILTPDQYTQFEAMRKRGPRGGNGGQDSNN